MEKNNYTLTAIVPFFNEEQTIKESVKNLEKITLINEIILVDDCSSDSSSEKAKVLANTLDKVTYLRLKKNKGKGGAVLSAINSVSSSHVVIHDADLEYNPNDIVKMFNSVKNIDTFVIGSRYLENKKMRLENMSLMLNFIEVSSTKLFNNLFGTKLTDIGSCYKLIPHQFLSTNDFVETGFHTELEILAKFIQKGGFVTETPISYTGRKSSDGKKNGILIMIKFFLKIFKLKYRRR